MTTPPHDGIRIDFPLSALQKVMQDQQLASLLAGGQVDYEKVLLRVIDLLGDAHGAGGDPPGKSGFDNAR